MSNTFEGGAPHMHGMHLAGIKMLVAIVNRADGDRATRLLRQMRMHFQLRCLAKGTSGSGFADLMGFGEIDKAAILCVAPGIRVRPALEVLTRELRLDKPGRGIAFSIPISGMAIPLKAPVDTGQRERIQNRIEEGVRIMRERVEYDLILAVVNEGHSEALVERSRAAGATGATVLNVRHVGSEDAVRMLGLSFHAEKEAVSILCTREQKRPIMEALNTYIAEDDKSLGIIFSLPVDDVTGLNTPIAKAGL